MILPISIFNTIIYGDFYHLYRRLCLKRVNVDYFNLERMYDKRPYHNLAHVRSCLDELKIVKDLCENKDSLEFALIYHDIIYDVVPKIDQSNEIKSAEYARNIILENDVCDTFGDKVYELIVATDHKRDDLVGDFALIADIDLSIFGQEKSKFSQYERGIRQEYLHFNDEEYRNGRIAMVDKFLSKGRIYQTDVFFDRYEMKARLNLAWLLELLNR